MIKSQLTEPLRRSCERRTLQSAAAAGAYFLSSKTPLENLFVQRRLIPRRRILTS